MPYVVAMEKVALIVVNYKNHQETKDFLMSLNEQKDRGNLYVFVANNDVGGGGPEALRPSKVDYSLEILSWPENKGYFGAAQMALAHIRQIGLDPDLVVVANSDLEIRDPFFVTKLKDIAQGANIGVWGPSIVSGLSGRETNPYMINRPTAFKMKFIKYVFSHWITCQIYQWLGLGKAFVRRLLVPNQKLQSGSVAKDCYAVHGAFLIFSRTYFDLGGNFHHPVFLYNEELFVAEFCKEKRLRCRFEPSLKIFHREHGSIGLLFSKQILRYKAEAARYFADKYFKS